MFYSGLGASCDTVLDAEFFIEPPASYVLVADRREHVIELNKSANTAVVEFLMEENSELSNVTFTSTCGSDCQLLGSVTSSQILGNVTINGAEAYLSFKPYINSFHHLSLQLMSGEASNVSYVLPPASNAEPDDSLVRKVALIRKSLPDFFYFDYEHVTSNSSSPVNLTAKGITALSFQVGPISDVGGTLSLGIKLVNDDRKDVVVFGCVSLGRALKPFVLLCTTTCFFFFFLTSDSGTTLQVSFQASQLAVVVSVMKR